MRVLQVCPYDLGRPGGVQRHVRDLSRALAAAGHRVTIAAPGPGSEARIHYVGTRRPGRLHGTSFELTWASRQALDTLATQHFDVVHVHTPWTPFMPWQLLRRLAPLVRVRVATFHDTPPPTLSGALQRAAYRILSRRLSHRLDAMIAVSESVEWHLRARKGCAQYRLPPCVDLRVAATLPGAKRDGPPVILFVGRIEPRKGLLLLVEALALLRARHPEAMLVVCGDGEQRAAAQALVQAKGLAHAVRFTGALDDAAKLALFAQATVLCAPSPYGESYGLVIAEAMAAGLPVVAAANDGYAALLQGEGGAGLAAPGSPEALAERLGDVLASPELRQRLSDWGRRAAVASDISARLPEFLAVYERSNGLGSGNQRSSSARR